MCILKKNSFVFLIFIMGLGFWACDEPPKHYPKSISNSDLSEGVTIFKKNCVTCHGVNGAMGMNGAANLAMSVLPLDERVSVITNGRKTMQSWKEILSEKEIKAVAEYTLKLKQ